MEKHARICLIPRLSGIGGMVSFQKKLTDGLKRNDIQVSLDLNDKPYDAVLVIGGSRQLHRLWQVKQQGIRIVQRLDGMNWVHRVVKTGMRHWLRAEYGNFILSTIRSSIAQKIAYQSNFSRDWWETVKGSTKCPQEVIHNGVDLTEFSPNDSRDQSGELIRILLVEGSLLGGYEFGLENAVKLSSLIAHSHSGDQKFELMIVGKVSQTARELCEKLVGDIGDNGNLLINWVGEVPHSEISGVYRRAHIFFSADINAACPNSVIESMACGTPVISFDTGALSELLANVGGIAVPYGGDPWQLDSPDIQSLAARASEILGNLSHYQQAARKRAEEAFSLNRMVERYIDLLLN
jgi:glycosyltransferase involved in cell wall biosynthesis